MTFSFARLFGYTRLLETELRRERILRRRDELRHERERRSLIDAVQRAANKPPVFERPVPPKQTPSRPAVFGPTMSARAQAERETEEAQKREVVAPSNGHRVDAPEIPSE